MKYEVRFTSQFKKDLKLAKKQGKDTANGEPLKAKYTADCLPNTKRQPVLQ